MSLYTHSGALPHHRYIHIEPNVLGDHGWLPAVWFGLVSHPGRTWGCHVLLECGAVYRNVPLHLIASRETDSSWLPHEAQTWDCYGSQFTTIQYPYLASMNAAAKLRSGAEHHGQYLFTAVPVADAFSAVPDQAKEFYFLELENGRFTAQPTNQVLIEDRSFTKCLAWPTFLCKQTQVWSAED